MIIENRTKFPPSDSFSTLVEKTSIPDLISVIIPTYNRAGLIKHSLESVRSQTYRPIELIIVDDGSKDNTLEVVKEWVRHSSESGDFRVHLLSQENRGAPAARNRGLIASHGEYIQFLDSDDLLHPRKFENQILLSKRGYDFVYGQTAYISDELREPLPYTGYKTQAPLLAFLYGLPWVTPSGIYMRALCLKVGPWNERLKAWQDWEYHCRLCLTTNRIGFLPETLSYVRYSHKDRITSFAPSAQWVYAGASAVSTIENLLKASSLIDKPVSSGLAMACFNIARRAALVGESEISRDFLHKGLLYANTVKSQIALTIFSIFALTFGFHFSGLLCNWVIDKTSKVRRNRRFKT